ncbi:MAG: hypothetical protein KDB82_03075 [Planctomycetes bacterium]|nr:hypothetical protein [Planctomycetota bacterium]
MGDSNANQAQQAFAHMVEGLFKRQATGRGVIAFELSEEVIAASLEGGAKQQNDAQVSDVSLQFFEDAAVFSARVKVKGKAWPPRPPVDTKVSFSAKEVTHSEVGQSGAVMFRVEKPLTFSSTFADVLAGVVGKLFKGLPVSLDSLRHRDSLVTIDFAKLIKTMRPDFAAHAAQVRLYNLKVTQSRVRVELGFVK